jgi:hypothetical protein
LLFIVVAFLGGRFKRGIAECLPCNCCGAFGTFEQAPFSGHVFVFRGKRGNRLPVRRRSVSMKLHAVVKPAAIHIRVPDFNAITTTGSPNCASELAMILDGIDVSKLSAFRRTSQPAQATERGRRSIG